MSTSYPQEILSANIYASIFYIHSFEELKEGKKKGLNLFLIP